MICMIQGQRCELKDGKWICDDPDLLLALRTATTVIQSNLSPADGHPDVAVFLRVVKEWDAEVIEASDYKSEPGVIH